MFPCSFRRAYIGFSEFLGSDYSPDDSPLLRT
jgi:hypothetical protein